VWLCFEMVLKEEQISGVGEANWREGPFTTQIPVVQEKKAFCGEMCGFVLRWFEGRTNLLGTKEGGRWRWTHRRSNEH